MLEAAVLVIFPLCMAFGAMTDLMSMTIPNRVSLVLMAAFAIIAPLAGLDLMAIGWHILGALTVFVVCFALFAFGHMGGGDAKILTASALWFGFHPELLGYLTTVAYLGGALTLLILVIRMQVPQMIINMLPTANGAPLTLPSYLTNTNVGVPYGFAIGAGALLTYPNSTIFRLVIG